MKTPYQCPRTDLHFCLCFLRRNWHNKSTIYSRAAQRAAQGRMWPPGPFYAAPGLSLKSRAGRKNYDCNLQIVQFYMESKTYFLSLDFTKIYIFHSISTYHRKFIWDQDWSLTTIFKPRTPNHRPFLNNPIKSQVDEKSTALPSGPTYFCITYRPYRLQ